MLKRVGIDVYFQQAPASDLSLIIASDYHIVLGHHKISLQTASCSFFYGRGSSYNKRFGSVNIKQMVMYDPTSLDLNIELYDVLRDIYWDLMHWRLSSGRIITISCNNIAVSFNVWGIFLISTGIPMTISQDVNFGTETLDVSMKPWLLSPIRMRFPWKKFNVSDVFKSDLDDIVSGGRLRNMSSSTEGNLSINGTSEIQNNTQDYNAKGEGVVYRTNHNSLESVEVEKEDPIDTIVEVRSVSTQITQSVMNTLHIQEIASGYIHFEWNLTVSTDGIFTESDEIEIENINVHLPIVSFTVDKGGPQEDGWTFVLDEFSFDVVKGINTRQRFSMSCNEGTPDVKNSSGGDSCSFYMPRFMNNQLKMEFHDYKHVNVSAKALTENVFTSFLGPIHWLDFHRQKRGNQLSKSNKKRLMKHQSEDNGHMLEGFNCVTLNVDEVYFVDNCEIADVDIADYFKLWMHVSDADDVRMARLDSVTSWNIDERKNSWFVSSYSELSLHDIYVRASLNASQALKSAAMTIHQEYKGDEMLHVDVLASWIADSDDEMGIDGNVSVYYNGDHVSLSQTRQRYTPKNLSVEMLDMTFQEVDPGTQTFENIENSRFYFTSMAVYDFSEIKNNSLFLLNSSKAVYMGEDVGSAFCRFSASSPVNGRVEHKAYIRTDQSESRYIDFDMSMQSTLEPNLRSGDVDVNVHLYIDDIIHNRASVDASYGENQFNLSLVQQALRDSCNSSFIECAQIVTEEIINLESSGEYDVSNKYNWSVNLQDLNVQMLSESPVSANMSGFINTEVNPKDLSTGSVEIKMFETQNSSSSPLMMSMGMRWDGESESMEGHIYMKDGGDNLMDQSLQINAETGPFVIFVNR